MYFSIIRRFLASDKIMPLFGKSQKSPAEVVKALKEAVNALERGDKKVEKVSKRKREEKEKNDTHLNFYSFNDYYLSSGPRRRQ